MKIKQKKQVGLDAPPKWTVSPVFMALWMFWKRICSFLKKGNVFEGSMFLLSQGWKQSFGGGHQFWLRGYIQRFSICGIFWANSERIHLTSSSGCLDFLYIYIYIIFIYKGWHCPGIISQAMKFQDPNSWTNHLLRWGCPGEHAIVGFGSYVARQFRLGCRPNQPVIPVVLKRFEANNNRFFRYFPHQFRVQDSRLTSHDLTCWGWKSCTAPSGKRILQFWMGIYQGKSLSHHFYFHCYLECHGRSTSPT